MTTQTVVCHIVHPPDYGSTITRLASPTPQVKRRLDYQVDTQNVAQGFQQKHLVNWVVDQVKSSITPQQEKDAIKQCLAELKTLAAKA